MVNRKLLTLAVGTVMAASFVFTGCGSTGNDSTSSDASENAAYASGDASGSPVMPLESGDAMGQGGPGGEAPDGQGGPGGDAPDGQGGPGEQAPDGQGGGGSSQPESYDANTEYTEDSSVSDTSIESTGTDENAVHAYNGASVSMKNMTISRNSSDSTGGDNSSFYGVGAAVLESDGTAYISDSSITSDAAGGAGVFAYGDGTVYISDSDITTKQDTSGGIHVAGGGTLYAWDPLSRRAMMRIPNILRIAV